MTDQGSQQKSSRRIPPLVWIVLALLVGWLVVAMIQRGGTDRTPGGGTHPMAQQGPSVMPPAPGDGTTPATPGSVAPGPTVPTQQ